MQRNFTILPVIGKGIAMSDSPFLSWMTRVYKGQFRSDSHSRSFQSEAYARELLREAKSKRHSMESLLSQIPFVILDTETTGFNPNQGDKIISISAAKTINGQIIDHYSTFVNPERQIPETITRLTGIEEQHVQNAPPLSAVINQLLSFVSESIILGYHINHDLSFLNHFLWTYYRSKFSQQYLELKQVVEVIQRQRFETLDDALSFHDITCIARHSAEGDVQAMVDLWKSTLKELKKRDINTLIELYGYINR